jgi:hypothetical protein
MRRASISLSPADMQVQVLVDDRRLPVGARFHSRSLTLFIGVPRRGGSM